ncbi:UNVERIFIED_CONTAM: Plant cysteine oxidase 2 [Sesamum latifolium]|uniref:cysteine dioxygenase n=1 Tax=Sesamum latifolium TaxID=2727402 RepID=A0AAW2Y7J2_9LAMI
MFPPSHCFFVYENAGQPDGLRLAKLKLDSELTAPCPTSILYPADGGNMHCFTAVTACAVLDVLGPPYSDPDGRHCQYYYDFPFADFPVYGLSVAEEEVAGHAWLKEREKPQDLYVVGVPYNGPKIVKT